MYNFEEDPNTEPFSFYGFYRGEVIDVADPLEAGRVRIRVFSIYDDIEDEHLPWAQYVDPSMGGQEEIGGFIVPDIGSHVWVFFENGDFMHPNYFAGAPAQPHQITERVESSHWETRGQPVYPRNKVFKTKSGHVIEVDDTPDLEKIRIKHMSGTETIMFENGDLYEHVMGDIYRVVEGNVHEIIKGWEEHYVHKTYYLDVTGDAEEIFRSNLTDTIKENSSYTTEGEHTFLSMGDATRTFNSNLDDQVDMNYTHTVTGTVTHTFESTKDETVTDDVSHTYKSNKTDQVSGDVNHVYESNKTEDVMGDSDLTIQGNYTVSVTGTTMETLTGAVSRTSTTSISITAPDVSINGA